MVQNVCIPMLAGWLASGFWVTSARMPRGWMPGGYSNYCGWSWKAVDDWVKDGLCHPNLVGASEHFLFPHTLGIIIPIDWYFWNGMKPPTSNDHNPFWEIHEKSYSPNVLNVAQLVQFRSIWTPRSWLAWYCHQMKAFHSGSVILQFWGQENHGCVVAFGQRVALFKLREHWKVWFSIGFDEFPSLASTSFCLFPVASDRPLQYFSKGIEALP